MTSLASGAKRDVVQQTEQLVRDKLNKESTGHDWWHAQRVRNIALRIADHEGADTFVVELAALLHDIDDYKFSGSDEAGPRFAANWLRSMALDDETVDHVAQIIHRISFKGALVAEQQLSLEGMCIQDADRLDALGAIGIARAFAYGGYVQRPIHDPDEPPVLHTSAESYTTSLGTTINHFHEKLLLLTERMNTEHGRAIAESRHKFMQRFLDRFDEEWAGQA